MEATLNVVTAMGAKAHWPIPSFAHRSHRRNTPTQLTAASGSTLRFLFPPPLWEQRFYIYRPRQTAPTAHGTTRSKSSAMARLCKGPRPFRPTPRRQITHCREISVPNTLRNSLLFLYCWKTVSFTWHQNRNPKHTLQ